MRRLVGMTLRNQRQQIGHAYVHARLVQQRRDLAAAVVSFWPSAWREMTRYSLSSGRTRKSNSPEWFRYGSIPFSAQILRHMARERVNS